MHDFDVAVIGQGYAGLLAAREARQRGLKTAAFEAVMVGGRVMTVLQLDPSPEGFTTSGPDLGAIIGMDNIDAGVVPFLEPITTIAPLPMGGWHLQLQRGVVSARRVVMATGTQPRPLGIPGEAALTGKGVSHCADCDGPSMIDRDCMVVGGGDAAFQEAAILARVARSVTIVIRADAPRARPDLVAKAGVMGNVSILTGRSVTAILGESWVTGVTLDDAPHTIACQGVFPFIGGMPDTTLLPSDMPRDLQGAILTRDDGSTELPGLFAIGSVRAGFAGGLNEAGEDARRVVQALAA